jgi:hypothetical protein
MGVRAAVVCAHWLVLDSMWVIPISTTSRDGCSDVELSREMYMATRACSSCDGRWGHGRWCYGWGCVNRGIKDGGPAVSLIQHVGWLDPVG